jgi:hypothetical protein
VEEKAPAKQFSLHRATMMHTQSISLSGSELQDAISAAPRIPYLRFVAHRQKEGYLHIGSVSPITPLSVFSVAYRSKATFLRLLSFECNRNCYISLPDALLRVLCDELLYQNRDVQLHCSATYSLMYCTRL